MTIRFFIFFTIIITNLSHETNQTEFSAFQTQALLTGGHAAAGGAVRLVGEGVRPPREFRFGLLGRSVIAAALLIPMLWDWASALLNVWNDMFTPDSEVPVVERVSQPVGTSESWLMLSAAPLSRDVRVQAAEPSIPKRDPARGTNLTARKTSQANP